MKIYIDGRYYEKEDAKVSVYDHGLLYGDGIFEGIRAYGGRIFMLREHIGRLYNSARAIFLDIPLPKEELERVICEAVRTNGLSDAYIRVLVTRGVGDLGLDMRKCKKATIIVIADKIALYNKEVYERGMQLKTSSLRRFSGDQLSPTIKSLNYLNNILARAEAAQAGCDEAILLNREGNVAECSGDNIFFVRDEIIRTPPVWAGILEGITRNVVIRLAREKLHLEVREEVFTVPELFRADEVFVTGTGAEIIGVTKVDNRVIHKGKPGPVTGRLIEEFRAFAASREAGVAVNETVKV